MLQELLASKKCFKLVCGAGNEDAKEVEKLVAVYAKAGADYFDLSARENVVKAAWKGLKRVMNEGEMKHKFLNVSVGIAGDPHVSKARIDEDSCVGCGTCVEVCNQQAIEEDGDAFRIIKKRCIGCHACIEACPQEAIAEYSENVPLAEVLPPLIDLGIHSIELHAVSDDEEKVFEQWGTINELFDGVLSMCVDRSRLGSVFYVNRISKACANRPEYSTIIQADGAPMSGTNDKASTTLEALATAQVTQKAQLPIFLMLSGGTNSQTTKLAQLFDIDFHGVAIGSFARKIIKTLISRDDFFENQDLFDEAVAIAKNLVDTSKEYMG